MAETFSNRLKRAWNVFVANEEKQDYYPVSVDIGSGNWGVRPDRRKVITGKERTIISAIYTRIALDVASTDFKHVRIDDQDRYKETIKSTLNDCLTVEANVDQSGFAFKLDIALSLLDEGCIAIVPVDTDDDPDETGSFKIGSMRVGKITAWYPRHVDVRLYNDRKGQFETVTLPKSFVAIVENPFYSVMNEKNSTMSRLVYKLGLLDDADAKNNSSKLDMIIQLPYTIKNETQEKRADNRKKSIETQLTNSKYGIAYIDATEKVTQLNRSIDNNLMSQINDLTKQLYTQLCIDETILNGTANAETMNNYYQRTVAPIIDAIKDEFNRKFLTKTARTQGQTIMTFQDPFRYMTVNQIAQMADTLSRNEILTPNEFRTALGFKPSEDESSDELRNRNLIDPNADYGSNSGYEDPSDLDEYSVDNSDQYT